jgi:hypothetical protein
VNKRDRCRARIAELHATPSELERLLLRECALPGRRANLELAAAFADAAGSDDEQSHWWTLVDRWCELSADEAPTNHPGEFLHFTALQAAGALYRGATPARRRAIVETLRVAACDDRWRTREAVALGLQRIGETDSPALREISETWMQSPTLLELRALLATWAHPPFLEAPEQTEFALSVAEAAMVRYDGLDADDRREPSAEALRKGLAYAPSVYVASMPNEGFSWLERWASSEDMDIKKIVAANLRKARLARAFPDQVEGVGDVLMA